MEERRRKRGDEEMRSERQRSVEDTPTPMSGEGAKRGLSKGGRIGAEGGAIGQDKYQKGCNRA
jgi:hypothetical protein